MSKQQIIVEMINQLPEDKLDTILSFIQFVTLEKKYENSRLSELSLAKDWLLPEEDEAWKDL